MKTHGYETLGYRDIYQLARVELQLTPHAVRRSLRAARVEERLQAAGEDPWQITDKYLLRRASS